MLNNEIHIGIRSKNHKFFDNLEKMDILTKPITISMIKIQYIKERILGIKIKYRGMNGKTIVGQSSRKFKIFGAYFEKFKIDNKSKSFQLKYPCKQFKNLQILLDDCIQEIFGLASTTINQLGFKTYKGQKVICGSPIGLAFSYYIPNHTFIAAKGSHDEFLEYLCFRISPLTQEQITIIGLDSQINKQQSFKK